MKGIDMPYYLFRVHGDQYRMEKGTDVREACKLAFGCVYEAPYNGTVVYKDIGTRSPKYLSNKVKQEWYKDEGWQVIGGTASTDHKQEDSKEADPTLSPANAADTLTNMLTGVPTQKEEYEEVWELTDKGREELKHMEDEQSPDPTLKTTKQLQSSASKSNVTDVGDHTQTVAVHQDGLEDVEIVDWRMNPTNQRYTHCDKCTKRIMTESRDGFMVTRCIKCCEKYGESDCSDPTWADGASIPADGVD